MNKILKTLKNCYIYLEKYKCIIVFLIVFFNITYWGINWLFRFKESGIIDEQQCRIIYDDSKRPRTYKIIKNLLTSQECKDIISEAEAYADEFKWTTDRHEHYPTTDNQIKNTWKSYNLLTSRVYDSIIPELSKMYNVEANKIGINEIFVAKYNNKAQKKLNSHEDGSEFSFVIALNDDYQGGGTYFTKLKKKPN